MAHAALLGGIRISERGARRGQRLQGQETRASPRLRGECIGGGTQTKHSSPVPRHVPDYFCGRQKAKQKQQSWLEILILVEQTAQ